MSKAKRLGRPRKGKEPRRRISFSVSTEDEVWLQTLPNRSEWLRFRVAEARKGDSVAEYLQHS